MERIVASLVAIVGVIAVTVQSAGQGQRGGTCPPANWAGFEARVKAAQARFQQRDPEPLRVLWSHREDVTLMGALGGHERGWEAVGARLARISATANGTHDDDQVVTRVVGADVAMWVQLEHITQRNPDATVRSRNSLRVTHVARCEEGTWRVVHRHADFLVQSQPPPR